MTRSSSPAHAYYAAPGPLTDLGAHELVDRALALDPRPLAEPRSPERRIVGNCHQFTLLLCAFLRARPTSTRAMPRSSRCSTAWRSSRRPATIGTRSG